MEIKNKINEVFAQQLGILINQSKYFNNRKALAQEIGITTSSLSQYVSGKTKPSFKALMALSQKLNVSLDYLVFGELTQSDIKEEESTLYKFIDSSLANLQAKANANNRIVAHIGEILMDKIVEVSHQIIEKSRFTPMGGIITDNETMTLENFSRDTNIISMDLGYDIKYLENGTPSPGRFTKVVADNLLKGYSYNFLLPGDESLWRKTVTDFREVLNKLTNNSSLVIKNCKIKVYDGLLFAGVGIYKLDESIKEKQPILYERLRENFIYENYLGYTIPPSPFVAADTLMDIDHLKRALTSFNTIWRYNAKKI